MELTACCPRWERVVAWLHAAGKESAPQLGKVAMAWSPTLPRRTRDRLPGHSVLPGESPSCAPCSNSQDQALLFCTVQGKKILSATYLDLGTAKVAFLGPGAGCPAAPAGGALEADFVLCFLGAAGAGAVGSEVVEEPS